MMRILKYLGGQAWVLVLALVCVAGQAFFELQLPDQMARLVNIGIQAHGVEDCAPKRITETDFVLAGTFMSGLGRRHALDDYHQVNNVYVRASLDDSELRRLNNVFSIASCAMVYAAHELPGDAGDVVDAPAKAALSEIEVGKIREELLENAPLSERAISLARSKSLALQRDLRTQIGQAMAGGFFQAAGGSLTHEENRFMAGETSSLIGLAATAMAFSLLVSVCAARVSSSLAHNLRGAVFEKTRKLFGSQVQKLTAASLLSRTTSDIILVQTFTMAGIRILAFALVMGVGGAVLASSRDPQLMGLLVIAVVGIIAVTCLIFGLTRPRYRIVQKMIDRLNLVTREDVDSPGTVRAYGGQKREEERFNDANELLADTQLRINRRLIFLSPSFTAISNLVGLFIVWNGAFQVQEGSQMVGDIIAYGQYATVSLAAFALVAGMFIVVPRVTVAADRILEVLDAPEPPVGTQAPGTGEGIRFESVTYTYPGRKDAALSDATIVARPGEVTAVVGRTGSGKSTLGALLERFGDPQAGQVSLNGRNVAAMPAEELRQAISFVPQRADWGERRGNCLFVESLEDSDADSERAILGALDRRCNAYVVDDALSHLDPGTKGKVALRLRELGKKASVLLLSHSVRDARCADQIYVLEHGRVAASGTHEQLMKSCRTYRRLAEAEQVPGILDE